MKNWGFPSEFISGEFGFVQSIWNIKMLPCPLTKDAVIWNTKANG
jgi:hypothetical protein